VHVCFVALKAGSLLSGGSLRGQLGGAEVQQVALARGLLARGYRVSFVVREPEGQAARQADGIRRVCLRDPAGGLPGLRFVRRWRCLHRALREAGADVYYQRGAGCETGQVAFFCRRQGRGFVFALGSDSDARADLPDLRTRRERFFYRWGLRRAGQVVAQTARQQARLRDELRVDSHLVRSMPPLDWTEDLPTPRARPESPPRLLWIGRLSREKRADWVLEMARQRPQWRFDLVGEANVDTPSARRVREQAARLSNVTLHGVVPRAGMPDLYRAADLVLCTSAWEGFPNTFLEAWWHSVPVSGTVDPDGVVEREGLGVVADDLAGLVRAAESLLTDAAAYQRCSARCGRHVREQHDPQAILSAMEQVLERAARAARGAGGAARGSVIAPCPAPRPLRVLLLISSLEHGGAERQVVELARRLDRRRFEPLIVSLSDNVPLASGLEDRERDLVIVPKRWKYDLGTVARVARLMRERAVDVVHAFLFDSEIVARLAARRARVNVVIASERNADYVRPWSHRVALRVTRSAFDVMIANSEAGKRFNVRTQRLDPDRIHVVRNGVDTERFRPTDSAPLRRELGILPGEPVVGMIAAFKRQKRHADYFRLAQVILRRSPEARFLCVGEPLRDNHQGAADYHKRMRALVETLGIAPRFLFLGRRDDMPAVYSLCDVTVLTSEHEGTPNVLIESLACGVPVVATDVADNRAIIRDGQVGYLAPVGDVPLLARRVRELLEDETLRRRLGTQGRVWVQSEFSLETMTRKTETVYWETWRCKNGVSPDVKPAGRPSPRDPQGAERALAHAE
jgi:glycosyltransferase involved in cell wall biosynthesis